MPACPTPVWCFEWVAACASNPVTQKPNGRHTLELNRYMIYRYSWKLDTFSHSLFQNFFYFFLKLLYGPRFLPHCHSNAEKLEQTQNIPWDTVDNIDNIDSNSNSQQLNTKYLDYCIHHCEEESPKSTRCMTGCWIRRGSDVEANASILWLVRRLPWILRKSFD